MSGATLASVSLTFDDAVFGTHLVALQLLYEATALSNSMELLRPGDSLRIRASGKWRFNSDLKPEVPTRAVREVAVRGQLWLTYLPDDLPVQKSSNFLPIQLQRNR